MKSTAIIARLKSEIPALSNRVGGTADLVAAQEQDDIPVPHAFVVPGGDVADEADLAGPITQQDMVEEFAVVVAVANTSDQIGRAAGDAVDDLRTSIWTALLGWEPAADHGPFAYLGSNHLEMSRARLWHQFNFVTQTLIQET